MKGPSEASKAAYGAYPEHKWMLRHLGAGVKVVNDETGIGYLVFPTKMRTHRKQSGKTQAVIICEIFEDDAGNIIRRPTYVKDLVRMKCPLCKKSFRAVRNRQLRWMQTTVEWDQAMGLAQAIMEVLGSSGEQRIEMAKIEEAAVKDVGSIRLDELKRKFGRGL